VLRPPAGVTQLILDTPGGLPELELNRLLLSTDALLIPVCDSTFDRESAAAFLATLRAHPRVATGRVRIAALGMRIDSRTHAAAALRQWAAGLEVPFVGALRATQGYVRCIEQGLTLFDLPAARVQTDLDQWQPVLDWLQPILDAAPAPRPTLPARHAVNPTPRLVPVQAAGAPMREPAAQRVHAVAPSPGKPSLPRVQALAPQRLGALASMRRLLGWA